MCVDCHIINEKQIILKSEATVEMRSIFTVMVAGVNRR